MAIRKKGDTTPPVKEMKASEKAAKTRVENKIGKVVTDKAIKKVMAKETKTPAPEAPKEKAKVQKNSAPVSSGKKDTSNWNMEGYKNHATGKSLVIKYKKDIPDWDIQATEEEVAEAAHDVHLVSLQHKRLFLRAHPFSTIAERRYLEALEGAAKSKQRMKDAIATAKAAAKIRAEREKAKTRKEKESIKAIPKVGSAPAPKLKKGGKTKLPNE